MCQGLAEMAHIIETLTNAGLCSEVYYKELYLPASVINGAALCTPTLSVALLQRDPTTPEWVPAPACRHQTSRASQSCLSTGRVHAAPPIKLLMPFPKMGVCRSAAANAPHAPC